MRVEVLSAFCGLKQFKLLRELRITSGFDVF
jgi:hypothetical protein